MSINKDKPFKCGYCGSTDVQRKEWVEVNSGQIMGAVSDGEEEDNWCPECMEYCEIIDNND